MRSLINLFLIVIIQRLKKSLSKFYKINLIELNESKAKEDQVHLVNLLQLMALGNRFIRMRRNQLNSSRTENPTKILRLL